MNHAKTHPLGVPIVIEQDGVEYEYLLLHEHERIKNEIARRWRRDQDFARRICRERGIDIDLLATEDPKYQ